MRKFLRIILASLCLWSLCLCVCILPTVKAKTQLTVLAETESAINVYTETDTALIAAPVVIMEYHDGDDIAAFGERVSAKTVRPATMIVEVDSDFNVSYNGEKMAYNDFRTTYIKSKMLPAVRVECDGAADALIEYLSNREYDFIDFSVVSSNPSLVKKVRDARPSIRGIIDYSSSDISNKTAGKLVNEANVNKAITVILGASQANAQFVFDVQARFKSVWVKQSVETEHDVYSALATGAVGIVSDNYQQIYGVYNTVTDSTLTRGFYGIGHRGLSKMAGENTLEGMIAAYEAGATHVELDTKVCASGEIIVMHDDGLSTTTNGTGNIPNMTLSEIRQYKVIKNAAGQEVEPCEIPTLEEVFTYFKGKDVVLVVETKNVQTSYPAALGALIDKYDIADQVVVIDFSTGGLGNMSEQVPEIPTANLNGTTKADFLTYMAQINALNTTMNPSKSGFITDSWMFRNSLARGYLPYSWTFTTESENEGAVARGCVGITTDCVDTLGDYAQKVLTKTLTVSDVEDELSIQIETYIGEEKSCSAKILSYKEVGENSINAILTYNDQGYQRLTEEILITIEEKTETPTTPPSTSGDANTDSGSSGDTSTSDVVTSESGEEKKQASGGCGSNLNALSVTVALLLAAAWVCTQKVKN